MSSEDVPIAEADLARVNAASLELVVTLAQEGNDHPKPNKVERAHAAEVYLARAETVAHRGEDAASPADPSGPAITDPGGIVV